MDQAAWPMVHFNNPNRIRLSELAHRVVSEHLAGFPDRADDPYLGLLQAVEKCFGKQVDDTRFWDWETLERNMRRYVARSHELNGRRVWRRKAVSFTDLEHPDGFEREVRCPGANPLEILLDKEAKAEWRRIQRQKLEALMEHVREVIRFARSRKGKDACRAIAVLLRETFQETPYEKLVHVLRALGFDPPDAVLFRQWKKRYAARYWAEFEAWRAARLSHETGGGAS